MAETHRRAAAGGGMRHTKGWWHTGGPAMAARGAKEVSSVGGSAVVHKRAGGSAHGLLGGRERKLSSLVCLHESKRKNRQNHL